jgi:hypothetical protein
LGSNSSDYYANSNGASGDYRYYTEDDQSEGVNMRKRNPRLIILAGIRMMNKPIISIMIIKVTISISYPVEYFDTLNMHNGDKDEQSLLKDLPTEDCTYEEWESTYGSRKRKHRNNR